MAGEGRGWGGRRNSHMTPEEEAGIQQATSPIEDAELRESLARLGRAVYAKTTK